MFNGANTAFMLLCAALVLLMTPGLAFFYGGLVGRKNTLTIMVQSFASMGITTILWWVVGYSLCFSGGGSTYAMLRVINLVTTVRVGAKEERGLDAAELGEAAYTVGAWPSSAAVEQ